MEWEKTVKCFMNLTETSEEFAVFMILREGELDKAIQAYFEDQSKMKKEFKESNSEPVVSKISLFTFHSYLFRKVREPIEGRKEVISENPLQIETNTENYFRKSKRVEKRRASRERNTFFSHQLEEGTLSKKEESLASLFNKPTHLMEGSFEECREACVKQKKWLIVNILDNSFLSHTVNRDVWKDKKIEKIVSSHFSIWQQYRFRLKKDKRKLLFIFFQQKKTLVIPSKLSSSLFSTNNRTWFSPSWF